MPVSTLTWRASAIGTLTTSTLADCLGGLKALVDAEVAANPSTSKWQVADYSSGNGTLVLKPRDGGTRRIMLFGGSSPNTNAIDAATAATTNLYIGLAPTAGVDAPQQAYATGVPFTTGQWVPGGIMCGTFTGVDRVQYWENAAGIFIVFRRNVMNQTSANLFTGFAGQLAVSLDGNTGYDICGGSAGVWTNSQDTNPTPGAGSWLGLGTETTAANSRTNYSETGVGIRRCRRHSVVTASPLQDNLRSSGQTRYFIPILATNSDDVRTTIKLRQIATGIRESHGQIINDASGPAATKIAFRSDQVEHGPWLTNFLV